MALLPFLAIGALLASSKKVRKEISRFAKKVKKKLKKVVKSKAFKIIAAAALIVTGAYFVAGLVQSGAAVSAAAGTAGATTAGTTAVAGTTAAATQATIAANAAATTAASTSGIVARTATAIANGARTAYTAVTNTAMSAGGSTSQFLANGLSAITNKIAGKTGGFDTSTFASTPADAARDQAMAIASNPTGVDPSLYALDTSKFTGKSMANIGDTSMSTDSILNYNPISAKRGTNFTIAPDPTKIVSRTPMELAQDATAQSITQETIAAETGAKASNSLLSASTVKEGLDKLTEPTAANGGAYNPSYGLLQEMEVAPLFTPEAMENFATHYPGANKEFMFGGQIDNTAYMKTKQGLHNY